MPAQEIEEIVVTARKRTESVQDIPLSISVFDEEAIAAAGIRDIDDIARLTPGLVFDKGWIPQDTRPHIRGLPTDRGRAPVGILVDGIDISSESMLTSGGGMLMNLKVMDIERIEVVKGPQSALYGRVAFGGAGELRPPGPPATSSKLAFPPTWATTGRWRRAWACPSRYRKRFGLRINAVTAQHDGYYENEVSGEGIGGFGLHGRVRAAAAFPAFGHRSTLTSGLPTLRTNTKSARKCSWPARRATPIPCHLPRARRGDSCRLARSGRLLTLRMSLRRRPGPITLAGTGLLPA